MAVRLFHLDQADVSEFRLWQAALELRCEVLKDQLGWDLFARAGREIDEYDNPFALHICQTDAAGRLGGYCRLNPCEKPFLLRDHFSHMFHCEFGDKGVAAESTRAVLSPMLKGPARTVALAEMMSSAMVLMGERMGLTRIYFVTEQQLVPHLMGPFDLDVTYFDPKAETGSLVAGWYAASAAKGRAIATEFGVDLANVSAGRGTRCAG